MPARKASSPSRLLADAAPDAPLAARMRPRTLDEIVGQDHLVGSGKLLRRLVEADRAPSFVLWGPPGTGKTTLARVVARQTKAHFEPMSAVSAGVVDLRRAVEEARERKPHPTILFIDEIHRFNKAQQDAVLPHVEDGTVTLVGATTENPSFEVIGPLLSRCRVFTLSPLAPESIEALLRRALADAERGLGGQGIVVDDVALQELVAASGGDARAALGALDMAAASVVSGEKRVTAEIVGEVLQHRTYRYDKGGDAHYDTISAFIKSVRGSDPDAALYWLARMIDAGEDPLFVVRRMVILAAEDVGLADPQALVVATACQQAVHFIGLPEGYLPMAECAIYLSLAPKSNSAIVSYGKALADARETRDEPVPLHLRNAVTGLMRSMGYGKGYAYDHDSPDHHSGQARLPDRLVGRTYYVAGDLGFEKRVKEFWEKVKSKV